MEYPKHLSFDILVKCGYSEIEAKQKIEQNVNLKRWKIITQDDKEVILDIFPNIIADIIMGFCDIIPTPHNAPVVPTSEMERFTSSFYPEDNQEACIRRLRRSQQRRQCIIDTILVVTIFSFYFAYLFVSGPSTNINLSNS